LQWHPHLNHHKISSFDWFFSHNFVEANGKGSTLIDTNFTFAKSILLLPTPSNMPSTFTNPNFSMLMHNTLPILDSIVHPTKPIERSFKKPRKLKWEINKNYQDW
jgi:hypothetical protein